MKTKKWQIPLVIVGALAALGLLNLLSSMKSPQEKITELISQHRGVIILVKSGIHEKDADFLEAIQDVRPRLRGTAGIILANERDELHEPGVDLPLMIVLDPHGNMLQSFSGSIDRELFSAAVNAIITHSH